ncbi:serine/threonine protein kinase [Bacillus salipaludis]|uniref:Serine/threonine protein kinase n=1 Tax=Bacillus salipaludis TaxID=2547811 RepID=A0ABW8RHR3_9BACI
MLKRYILLLSNLMERPFPPEEIVSERYKVREHLGTGSYGHSYLVEDLLNQQKKVLKALRLHKRKTRSGRSSFELEKELLLSIEHPGFPKYFEDGMYKNIPYYTMEFIDGKNFEQLIFSEGKNISEREAFKIAVDLLQYIEYLHTHNIVHRDIRIPNVIFDGTRIRLIDLGLGRHLKQEQIGEAVSGIDLRKQINFQADFYGLGHFLLFLLYSNFSFNINQKEKSWEEELDVSNEAKHIIRRLLQIEPSYDTCSQVRADINKLFEF